MTVDFPSTKNIQILINSQWVGPSSCIILQFIVESCVINLLHSYLEEVIGITDCYKLATLHFVVMELSLVKQNTTLSSSLSFTAFRRLLLAFVKSSWRLTLSPNLSSSFIVLFSLNFFLFDISSSLVQSVGMNDYRSRLSIISPSNPMNISHSFFSHFQSNDFCHGLCTCDQCFSCFFTSGFLNDPLNHDIVPSCKLFMLVLPHHIVGYCPVDWSSLSEVTSSVL